MNASHRFLPFLTGILVLSISAIVFSQYGFEGAITRDTANALYSGQQMARGIPPFVSIFNHSGSSGPLLSGIGVWLATVFSLDDILIVRIIFFIIGSLAATSLYFFTSDLFESRRIGFLAVFTFLGFGCFGKHTMTGPSGKISLVLFETLSLLFMVRKGWFLAGICGSLAFLAWQPAAIYALVAIILAFAQSKPGRERILNIIRTASGAAIPLIAVSLYFLSKSAFYEFIDGTILFNLYHLEREPSSIISHLGAPVMAIFRSYTIMAIPMFLGFLAILIIYVWRLKLCGRSITRLLSEDRFAPILLSFPAPVIWSVLDFQGCPDLYIFLPYLASGFAWLLYMAFQRLIEVGEMRHFAQKWSFILLCGTLIATAATHYKITSEKGLNEQRRWASEVESRFGSDSRLVSIGVPEILVLLHRTNPNPYVFIVSGIDNHINAARSDGFDGWLKELQDYDPQIIAFGPTRGRFKSTLTSWLEFHYSETNIGDWKLFVRQHTNNITPVR